MRGKKERRRRRKTERERERERENTVLEILLGLYRSNYHRTIINL